MTLAPEPLDFNEALDLLSQAADGKAEPGTVASMDAIGRNILVELNRRLGDPELAKDLPGTALIGLAKEYLKAQKPQTDTGPSVVPDVLDLIDHPGLPADRKRALVEQEIRACENRLEQCRMILGGLDGDDAEAVPEVPPLLHETRW